MIIYCRGNKNLLVYNSGIPRCVYIMDICVQRCFPMRIIIQNAFERFATTRQQIANIALKREARNHIYRNVNVVLGSQKLFFPSNMIMHV